MTYVRMSEWMNELFDIPWLFGYGYGYGRMRKFCAKWFQGTTTLSTDIFQETKRNITSLFSAEICITVILFKDKWIYIVIYFISSEKNLFILFYWNSEKSGLLKTVGQRNK